MAPKNCANMYKNASFHGNAPLIAKPKVIAGLNCPPETLPNIKAGTKTAKP